MNLSASHLIAMNQRCFLQLALLGILFPGCRPERVGEVAPPAAVPATVVVCLDGSRSYRVLEKAKADTLRFLTGLGPSSRVFCRWITDQSDGPECVIFSAIIPPRPERLKNPFDLRARQQILRQQKLGRDFSATLSLALEQAPRPNSSGTDIWGALFAAGQRLKDAPQRRLLLLMSDLNDTCARYYPGIWLPDVEVWVLDYQSSGPTDAATRSFWTDALTRRGARSVRFILADEPKWELP